MLLSMKLQYDETLCDGCGVCSKVCPQQIIVPDGKHVRVTDPLRCMGCFGCEDECHTGAFRLLRSQAAGEEPAVELEG
jgi:ferredoxin